MDNPFNTIGGRSVSPHGAMLAACALLSALAPGCRVAPVQVVPQPRTTVAAAPELPRIPAPDPGAAEVPFGYRVEIVASGLTYPSSVEFDPEGNMYIAEAGYAYGDQSAPARVLRIRPDGISETVAEQLNGPVTDLLWHEGLLYISHRGKVSIITNNTIVDVVTGLPSLGDHQNNQLTAGPDGRIYLGQGTASNSGVVGVDNYAFGWLGQSPDFHDLSPFPIRLAGRDFATINPLTLTVKKESLAVRTGAFQPFGSSDARQIDGTLTANGTVLAFNPDGSGLQVFAWGFRNPFGVMWASDRQLYVSDNGFDERGSRPIANAPDVIWRVEQGFWYGWPDYAGGVPVTDKQFKPENGPQPEFLMENHPSVQQPLARVTPHSGVTKIDFSRSSQFGFEGHLFVGEVGDTQPITGNDIRPVGHQVVRINPATGEVQPFFRARADTLGLPYMEYVTTPGPKRIVDVKFSPEGESLYIADLGAMMTFPTPNPVPRPFPNSGVIWRVSRDDAQPRFPTGFSFNTPVTRPANIPSPTGRAMVRTPQLTTAEAVLDGWKPRPADLARQMIVKYGPPNEATPLRLVWHNNHPWKRTEVLNDEIPHHFPKPHSDIMTQTINFPIPVDRIDDLAAFDGSIIADRTRGELSVRGDNEQMNFLTANLANEILVGIRSVRDARKFFTEAVRQMKNSDYTAGFLFTPSRLSQGDPGEAIPLP